MLTIPIHPYIRYVRLRFCTHTYPLTIPGLFSVFILFRMSDRISPPTGTASAQYVCPPRRAMPSKKNPTLPRYPSPFFPASCTYNYFTFITPLPTRREDLPAEAAHALFEARTGGFARSSPLHTSSPGPLQHTSPGPLNTHAGPLTQFSPRPTSV